METPLSRNRDIPIETLKSLESTSFVGGVGGGYALFDKGGQEVERVWDEYSARILLFLGKVHGTNRAMFSEHVLSVLDPYFNVDDRYLSWKHSVFHYTQQGLNDLMKNIINSAEGSHYAIHPDSLLNFLKLKMEANKEFGQLHSR